MWAMQSVNQGTKYALLIISTLQPLLWPLFRKVFDGVVIDTSTLTGCSLR